MNRDCAKRLSMDARSTEQPRNLLPKSQKKNKKKQKKQKKTNDTKHFKREPFCLHAVNMAPEAIQWCNTRPLMR
jgi:predicted alpha/beta superfamily hydrolase